MNASRWVLACSLLILTSTAHANVDGVSFKNIATDVSSGLHFEQKPYRSFFEVPPLLERSLTTPFTVEELANTPIKSAGITGVAVFDYDLDGDLDVFITNGADGSNSLFANQLNETGSLHFVDMAAYAGVSLTEQESSGVSYGDIDNDGDPDLLILSQNGSHSLLENLGDGTFVKHYHSGLEADGISAASSSFADFNGDGLLDVVIGNTFNHDTMIPLMVEPYALTFPNKVYFNKGNFQFEDVSEKAGITNLKGLPAGIGGITWAVGAADIDTDGDVDIVFADDQGILPDASRGGVDRGFIHVLLNDGKGRFSYPDNFELHIGTWMGLAFGDLNADGKMDIFASNFGNYQDRELESYSTRWFLGDGSGRLLNPKAGTEIPSLFGWGNAIIDIDNDGDQDPLYLGAMNMNVTLFFDNPGVVLENDGNANFTPHADVFTTDYSRLGVQGVAVGDLNRDGYVDVVTGSSFSTREDSNLMVSPAEFGSALDGQSKFIQIAEPTAGFNDFVWTGERVLPGALTVEINQSKVNKAGITVKPIGGAGLIHRAKNNRDGIGTVVSFKPKRGDKVMSPIQGGSSYASQHATEAYFGLGDARKGYVEVLWQGGKRSRLYGVKSGEYVVMPEPVCSYDNKRHHYYSFFLCTLRTNFAYAKKGVISDREAIRHIKSAMKAYRQFNRKYRRHSRAYYYKY